MPSVLPRSSEPCRDFFSHLPACSAAFARGTRCRDCQRNRRGRRDSSAAATLFHRSGGGRDRARAARTRHIVRDAAAAAPGSVDLRGRSRRPSPGAAARGARAVRDRLDRLARRVAARELARRRDSAGLCRPGGTGGLCASRHALRGDDARSRARLRIVSRDPCAGEFILVGPHRIGEQIGTIQVALAARRSEPRDGVGTCLPDRGTWHFQQTTRRHRRCHRGSAAAAAGSRRAQREHRPAYRDGPVGLCRRLRSMSLGAPNEYMNAFPPAIAPHSQLRPITP